MSRMIEIKVTERYLVPDPPTIELPSEDEEPLESPWHRAQINLLIETLQHHWQGRTDYFVGGNMFLYYSARQVKERSYKGPDFFLVKSTDGQRLRKSWIVWEEDGRYPNLIVELLSPTTAAADLGPKKELYERTFKTPEYFCFDPETNELKGWRLVDSAYIPMTLGPQTRLWSNEVQLFLGPWLGPYQNLQTTWLRWFSSDGRMVPTGDERAKALEPIP